MSDAIAALLRPEKAAGTACAGCGLRIAHRQALTAVHELGLGPADLVWGTAIGCSGRQTYATWTGDTFAGTHGRVYAIATGLRLALPPQRRLLLTVGDGDAFTIGLNHLLHAARRNVDMTVVVLDNLGYQSTGGQYGITTPLGYRTDSSPSGAWEPNWTQGGLDVLDLVRAAGATFVARHTVAQRREPIDTLKEAIPRRGFSLVHLIYPCVSHFGAHALGTRDAAAVHRWFAERTTGPDGAGVDGVAFRCGVLHRGERREFGDLMRAQAAGGSRA